MSAPSLLQRTLRAVWPQQAATRELARARLAALDAIGHLDGMDGAGNPQASAEPGQTANARRWSWGAAARDARADTLPRLTLHRGQSRYLARTSPIAVGAIQTNKDRVVGTGLALSANPNAAVLGWTPEQAREWKRTTQAEFSLWADSTECDQAATQNFYELQYLLLGAVLESGDAFTLLPSAKPTPTQPHTLRVQIVEADRIGNPMGKADTATEAGGIRFANGKPVAAHIYGQHPGNGTIGAANAGEWVTFTGASGRRRLLHHFRKTRPDQPRGVPYITPIVDLIKQLGDYADAEVKAAVISAYFTVFLTRKEGEAEPLLDGGAATDSVPGSSPAQAPDVAMGPGAVVELNPGEDATLANPNRPNPNFDAFVTSVMRQIGMALGIPSELLLKQFNASYSASKAALLDAWVYFRSVRTWLARSFCQPVYETWLAEAVAAGRISAPGFFTNPLMRWAYCQASWPGDSMGSINPKDEVAAYTAAIDARLVSRERAEWELFGTDFADTFGQKLAENTLLKANDMLPVPKAGAAAPTTTQPDAAP